MKLIISNQIKVITNNQKIKDELKKTLTKSNPIFFKMQYLNKPTYGIPNKIKMYEEQDGVLIIPSGTGLLARITACKYGIKHIDVIDERFKGHKIDVRFNLSGKFKGLYSYQQDFIDVTRHQQFGVLVAPCGMGKTVSSLGIIVSKSVSTLIIVHTSELMKQWLDEIKNKLHGIFTIGQIGNSKKQLGDITIAMNQTLTRFSYAQYQELSKYFGLVIVDEVQHCPASSFLKVIMNLSCQYIYGVSATPTRKDQLHFILYNYIGPIIHQIKDKELERHNRLVPVKVKYIKTNRAYNFKAIGENWPILIRNITNDSVRNKLIIQRVSEDIDNKRFPMILCNRTKQVTRFVNTLEQKDYKVGILMGMISKYSRDECRRKTIDNKVDVIVCIDKIAGEGLDIPPIDTIHLVFPMNNKNNFKQYIGRGRRVYKNKKYCQVYIYEDYIYYEWNGIEYQHRMGKNIKQNQLQFFKEFNFEVEV